MSLARGRRRGVGGFEARRRAQHDEGGFPSRPEDFDQTLNSALRARDQHIMGTISLSLSPSSAVLDPVGRLVSLLARLRSLLERAVHFLREVSLLPSSLLGPPNTTIRTPTSRISPSSRLQQARPRRVAPSSARPLPSFPSDGGGTRLDVPSLPNFGYLSLPSSTISPEPLPIALSQLFETHTSSTPSQTQTTSNID